MKINSIDTIKLKVPLNRPMKTRYITIVEAYCLLLILKTENGLKGQGLVRSVSLSDVNIINHFINDCFSPKIIGQHISSPEEAWNLLWLNKRNHLQSGFGRYALAAVDIAIWDIHAQQQNKPLHQLLGIDKNYVIPYGNGGWLIDSNNDLIHDVNWYLSRGCNHFKIRVGSEHDLARIKLLREIFGNELILSADANQYFDFNSALEMSKNLADFNVIWFEEPLFSNSITELAQLAELSPVPIAAGENMNSFWQIQDACQLNAARILQPDVIYQGGITEFKRSAEIINSFH